MNPTTNNENYNYDFYEVSYTCLGTQYPNLNNSLFPNITFANQEYIDYVAANYPNLLSDLQSRTKLPPIKPAPPVTRIIVLLFKFN